MIVTEGGRFGGYGLFLSKGELGFGRGKVVFLYNLLDLKRTIMGRAGAERRQTHHRVRLQVRWTGLRQGGHGRALRGRQGSGEEIHGAHAPRSRSRRTKTFDIGQDTRTGVAMLEYRYDVPFKFTGKINKLTFKLEPEPAAG